LWTPFCTRRRPCSDCDSDKMPPTRVSMQTASVAEHIPSVDTRTGHVTWEPPQPQQSSTSEEDDSTTSSSSTMMIQGTLAVTYACSQTKMEVQVLGTEGSLTPRRKRTARDIPSRFIVSRATATTTTPMLRNQDNHNGGTRVWLCRHRTRVSSFCGRLSGMGNRSQYSKRSPARFGVCPSLSGIWKAPRSHDSSS